MLPIEENALKKRGKRGSKIEKTTEIGASGTQTKKELTKDLQLCRGGREDEKNLRKIQRQTRLFEVEELGGGGGRLESCGRNEGWPSLWSISYLRVKSKKMAVVVQRDHRKAKEPVRGKGPRRFERNITSTLGAVRDTGGKKRRVAQDRCTHQSNKSGWKKNCTKKWAERKGRDRESTGKRARTFGKKPAPVKNKKKLKGPGRKGGVGKLESTGRLVTNKNLRLSHNRGTIKQGIVLNKERFFKETRAKETTGH